MLQCFLGGPRLPAEQVALSVLQRLCLGSGTIRWMIHVWKGTEGPGGLQTPTLPGRKVYMLAND